MAFVVLVPLVERLVLVTLERLVLVVLVERLARVVRRASKVVVLVGATNSVPLAERSVRVVRVPLERSVRVRLVRRLQMGNTTSVVGHSLAP
jgi:hypothetical protein